MTSVLVFVLVLFALCGGIGGLQVEGFASLRAVGDRRLLDEVDSLPTARPTSLSTTSSTLISSPDPTNVPSTSPSTSVPSYLPPSSAPSVFPNPTSSPASVAFPIPTSNPTSIPTPTPTISFPSTAPTSVPSAVPWAVPSSVPTTVPSTLPTTVPTTVPTTIPTCLPTALPTVGPTRQPSSVPSSRPSLRPSSPPSSQPSGAPSSSPTSSPSTSPTPEGGLGTSWWWVVSARSTLLSTASLSLYGEESVTEDVELAFLDVLTQYLDPATKTQVIVDATATEKSATRVAPAEAYSSSYAVNVWCGSSTAFEDVQVRMRGLAVDGRPLVPLLQGQGLYSVAGVAVVNVTHFTTSLAPPVNSDENHNPEGISLIILGTLFAFFGAAGLVYLVVNAYTKRSLQALCQPCAACAALLERVWLLARGETGLRLFHAQDDEEEVVFGHHELTERRGRGGGSNIRHLDIHFRDKYDDVLHENNGNDEDLQRRRVDFLSRIAPKRTPSVSAGAPAWGRGTAGGANPLHGESCHSTGSADSVSTVGFQASAHGGSCNDDDSDDLVDIQLASSHGGDIRRGLATAGRSPTKPGFLAVFGSRASAQHQLLDSDGDDGVL